MRNHFHFLESKTGFLTGGNALSDGKEVKEKNAEQIDANFNTFFQYEFVFGLYKSTLVSIAFNPLEHLTVISPTSPMPARTSTENSE